MIRDAIIEHFRKCSVSRASPAHCRISRWLTGPAMRTFRSGLKASTLTRCCGNQPRLRFGGDVRGKMGWWPELEQPPESG